MSNRVRRRLRSVLLAGLTAATLLGAGAEAQAPRDLELVIAGGRVMDPETGLDAVRDVGVREGRIVALEPGALAGRLREGGTLLRAAGRVVAPGFIDLHAHGQSTKANEFQVHDGVTTALELEWGTALLGSWLEARRGKALAHFGASVSHGITRALAMPDSEVTAEELARLGELEDPLRALQGRVSKSFYEPLAPSAYEAMRSNLQRGLEEGALGIGMAHQYTPGARREEIFEVFRFAGERRAPIYTHVRTMGIDAFQEVLANAAATGAPLHIVHINSSSLRALPTVLALVDGARRHGVDVTAEAYPYPAASTGLQSAIFDDGWQELLGISYGDLQWQDTGERLTAETFNRYRRQGGTVIIHMMPEEMIRLAMSTPWVIVASDGMPYAPGAHPRSAGTFSRVLGRYVREQGAASLMSALERMTLLPARRLESIAPQMRRKGRVQIGADADLVVFDPGTIADTATFEGDLSFSTGIDHVVVGGTPVVRDRETVDGVFPGEPIVGRYANDAP